MSEFNYFKEKRRMIEGLGGLTGNITCGTAALGLVSEEEYQEKCCEYPTAGCEGCWNTEVEE